jgi:hypothetical protein
LETAAAETAHTLLPKPYALSPELVGPGRLELPTLRLSGVRSNHLSYGPMLAKAKKAPLGSRSRLRPEPAEGENGKRNEDGGVPHVFRFKTGCL